MTRTTIISTAFATTVVFVTLAVAHRHLEQEGRRPPPRPVSPPDVASSRAMTPSTGKAHEGLLYGRVSTDDGVIYEGRLRFGGKEEAFWGHYFNAVKDQNPWATHVPRERLPTVRDPIEVFGKEIAAWEHPMDLGRPFMVRFGDIARIEAPGRDLRVVLKSGTVFDLDRFGADDFADGVRVWDDRHGVVDVDEWRIRTIEFLPTGRLSAVPDRLYGTVRTRHGDFTGFIQWNREESVGLDELDGHADNGEFSLRFDHIRSIARHSRNSSLVTLLDGREIVLFDTREVGRGNRGIYVDDRRYGRVLVSWDAFERIDFSAGGAGPAYGTFPPGRPLTGSVITRSGRRIAGRLIYDLDESETTETLDAPAQGVHYTIPFGLIASIGLPAQEDERAQPARVTLRNGEELRLELADDLGEWNAGMLIFFDDGQRPAYVPWTDVQQVDLNTEAVGIHPGR